MATMNLSVVTPVGSLVDTEVLRLLCLVPRALLACTRITSLL